MSGSTLNRCWQAGPPHGAASQRACLVAPEVPAQGRGLKLLQHPQAQPPGVGNPQTVAARTVQEATQPNKRAARLLGGDSRGTVCIDGACYNLSSSEGN